MIKCTNPNCQSEMPAGAKFCGECGTPMAVSDANGPVATAKLGGRTSGSIKIGCRSGGWGLLNENGRGGGPFPGTIILTPGEEYECAVMVKNKSDVIDLAQLADVESLKKMDFLCRTYDSLQILRNFIHLEELEIVDDISSNYIATSELSVLSELHSLRRLKLEFLDLREDWTRHFASLKQLRQLELSCCTNATSEAISQLNAKLPDCRIRIS